MNYKGHTSHPQTMCHRQTSLVTRTYWTHLSLSQRWGPKEIHERVGFCLLKEEEMSVMGSVTQALAGWGAA